MQTAVLVVHLAVDGTARVFGQGILNLLCQCGVVGNGKAVEKAELIIL